MSYSTWRDWVLAVLVTVFMVGSLTALIYLEDKYTTTNEERADNCWIKYDTFEDMSTPCQKLVLEYGDFYE